MTTTETIRRPSLWERLKMAFNGSPPAGHLELLDAIAAAHREVIAQGDRISTAVDASSRTLTEEVGKTKASVALLAEAMGKRKAAPRPRPTKRAKTKNARSR